MSLRSTIVPSSILAAGLVMVWLAINAPSSDLVRHVRVAKDNTVFAHVVLPNANGEPVSSVGLAHYTEHLVWENAFGEGRDVDRDTNAWTSDIAVGYWLSGPPEDLTEILAKLKRVFDPLTVSAQYAEEEREIILREYQRIIKGKPVAQAREDMQAFLYDGTPRGQSVIGTPTQIEALTYDQAKALHTATYLTGNAVLVVTGDVSQRQLTRALRDVSWPDEPGEVAEHRAPQVTVGPPVTQTYTYAGGDAAPRLIWRKVVTLPEPVQFDLLEAQTALLTDILRANLPGGVAGPLRFDAATARSFDISVWPLDEDNIEIEFVAAPDSGVTLTELEEAFTATLAEIAASGIPEDTYARVLARFEGFWPDWSDEDETAEWMADYVLDRVSIIRPPLSERELKRLDDELSLTTTNTLLRQLAGDGRTAIAYVSPEERFH